MAIQSDDVSADKPLGVITRAELEEARRDPNVRALHDEADLYLAELERQGLNHLGEAGRIIT